MQRPSIQKGTGPKKVEGRQEPDTFLSLDPPHIYPSGMARAHVSCLVSMSLVGEGLGLYVR